MEYEIKIRYSTIADLKREAARLLGDDLDRLQRDLDKALDDAATLRESLDAARRQRDEAQAEVERLRGILPARGPTVTDAVVGALLRAGWDNVARCLAEGRSTLADCVHSMSRCLDRSNPKDAALAVVLDAAVADVAPAPPAMPPIPGPTALDGVVGMLVRCNHVNLARWVVDGLKTPAEILTLLRSCVPCPVEEKPHRALIAALDALAARERCPVGHGVNDACAECAPGEQPDGAAEDMGAGGDRIEEADADPIAARDAMINTLQRDLATAREEARAWANRWADRGMRLSAAVERDERSAIERAHADGVVEGLRRAEKIVRAVESKQYDVEESFHVLREDIAEEIAKAERDAPADRQPHVDRAALLALAEGWETEATEMDEVIAGERARLKAGKVSRFMLGFMTAVQAVHRTCAADTRRLLDAPRGPGGGERRAVTPEQHEAAQGSGSAADLLRKAGMCDTAERLERGELPPSAAAQALRFAFAGEPTQDEATALAAVDALAKQLPPAPGGGEREPDEVEVLRKRVADLEAGAAILGCGPKASPKDWAEKVKEALMGAVAEARENKDALERAATEQERLQKRVADLEAANAFLGHRGASMEEELANNDAYEQRACERAAAEMRERAAALVCKSGRDGPLRFSPMAAQELVDAILSLPLDGAMVEKKR